MATDNKEVRIIMWTTPRSISTAIERSIVTMDDAEVFNEMYSASYHFGPRSKHFLPLSPWFSLSWVKSELEKDYPGKNVIFAKDFAYAVNGNFKSIPHGFTHTFLIRNPRHVLASRQRMIRNSYLLSMAAGSFKKTKGKGLFKDMWELYVYARDTLNQRPIVIDADDFLSDPEAMMKLYCRKTGIPFKESMLKWEPTNIWSINWHSSYALSIAGWLLGFYGNALNSTGFQKAKKQPHNTDTLSMDEHFLKEVNDSMEYYKLMYDNRLTI